MRTQRDGTFFCDGKRPGDISVVTEPQMTGFSRHQTGKFPVQSLWANILRKRPERLRHDPEGLEMEFTRQMTGKTRHLGVFSRQNRVFSRHKQMSSPSGFPLPSTNGML